MAEKGEIMLVLKPETHEQIVLYDRDSGRRLAVIKPFRKEFDGEIFLAFDAPAETQITREPISGRAGGNGNHRTDRIVKNQTAEA